MTLLQWDKNKLNQCGKSEGGKAFASATARAVASMMWEQNMAHRDSVSPVSAAEVKSFYVEIKGSCSPLDKIQ